MRKYVFIQRPATLPESLVKNQTVLDLVRKISYLDMISALVNDLGFVPSDAEQTVGMLMRHANQPEQEDEMFPHREVLRPVVAFAQSAIPPYVFPDTEEEPEEWPYDDATKGVMNTPYAGTPRMTT